MKMNQKVIEKKALRLLPLCILTFMPLTATAQQVLTLDSCRAMALRSNKQMDVSRIKQDVARNLRKSARTKYLPHISAMGTYQFTSEEISILTDDQKSTLSGLGDGLVGMAGNGLTTLNNGMATILSDMELSPAALAKVGNDLQGLQNQVMSGMDPARNAINAEGQKIVDAFRTDTRNVWAGSVMAIQPVFMGGSIVALNKLANLGEDFARNSAEARHQSVIYSVDQLYWQVVSLNHKKRLAQSFLEVVQKLDGDVQKMIAEGVATRSDGLTVSVKVNEAEMAVQKVNDGLVLSKMLLCQTVGLPMNSEIVLADENAEDLSVEAVLPELNVEGAISNRPELKMLENTVDMSRQATNILKAGNLPMVALTGGYLISNPSVYNGFEKKFKGCWNVGVLVRVPLWNWGDVAYKVRASKGTSAIATLELDEAREKVELQANQTAFKAEESNKRLAMAKTSVEKADENLRMANLGFTEGVITPATVMEAQTAWLQAKSQLIDAQIDVLMSTVDLQKVQGTLTIKQ